MILRALKPAKYFKGGSEVYTEFLIIYIGLGILLALAIVNLILILVLMKKDSGFSAPRISSQRTMPMPQTTIPGGNVVFCKKCAAEFDASQRCCPICGTPR